jgi:hypothetical protein
MSLHYLNPNQYAFDLKPRSLSVHYSPQHVMAAKIDLYSAFFSFRINRQIVCGV